MTEADYLLAENLTRVRVVEKILLEIVPHADEGEEFYAAVRKALSQIESARHAGFWLVGKLTDTD
jgi:hypothetical protein